MSVSSDDGYIYVNYGRVNDVLDAFNDADQQIQAVLSDLSSFVTQNLAPTWGGVSADEYAQVQARWNWDVTDMSQFLKAHAATLEEMTINYSNTDGNLAFRWSEIT